jgi:hypothetical protein
MIDYVETSDYVIIYDTNTEKFSWVVEGLDERSCCFDRASEAIEDVVCFLEKYNIESK